MPWKRCGLIYALEEGVGPKRDWAVTHAQLPTPDRLSDHAMRIYFGTRDAANRTRTTFVDVEAARPERILYIHDRPVLDLGELGCFDDAGVMPFCIVNVDNAKFLYYAGWNTSTTVPYRVSVGLAVSEDGGRSFRRVRKGPILDRTLDEPHFCSAPFVVRNGRGWRMWYLSCLSWQMIDGRPEPQYHVKLARSEDGLHWYRDGSVAIELAHPQEAITRPWVLPSAKRWRMWYCHRSLSGYRTHQQSGYRIGYAESADKGATWTRADRSGGLQPARDGWDCQMTGYPAVYEQAEQLYLLYNGNGFGQSGIGYAVASELGTNFEGGTDGGTGNLRQ